MKMARHKSKLDTKINNFTQFKEEDNLRLSEMTIPEIPKDILFPDELNQYLRGQVQFLTHSNGMLQKNLSEKDILIENYNRQIINLTAKISEYEQFADKSQNGVSHLVSTKIVELSKKLRDKNAEIESLKTKYAKMQQKLFNLENNVPKTEPTIENKITETTNEKEINYEEELKLLQDKLSQTTNKLFEQKNINYQLKNDLKTANKILQQELGDSFTSIQSLTNSQSNWRGRAQQILSLQQKNSELLEKLSLQSDAGTEASINCNKSDNRKLIIEQLQKELSNEKNTTEEIRKKLNGARARTKVLETECFSFKSKLNSLTEKCHHDAELIKFLNNQISNMEEGQNDIRKEKQNIIQKLEEEIKNLNIEISKDKCMIENFKEKLSDKDFRINELEIEMRFGRNSAGSSSISIVSHDLVKENNKIKQLELDIQRLLDLTADLNTRLDQERNKHSETQINFRKEKQKTSKLELKISRIELESNMNKSTTYSSKSATKLSASNSCQIDNNCLSIETLKNSLELAEENISILKSRLDILQKEKDLDFQRFSVILAESTGILKKSISTN